MTARRHSWCRRTRWWSACSTSRSRRRANGWRRRAPPPGAPGLGRPSATRGCSGVFLWLVHADARGRWVAELPELGGRWQFDITQKFQVLDVDARAAGSPMVVRGARLRGEEMRLAVTGVVGGKGANVFFRGKVADGRIEGEARVSDGETARTVAWKATRQ